MMSHSRILPFAVLGALVALAPGATAQREDDETFLKRVFRRYDPDGDGEVERKEYPGSDDQFASLDRNGDGHVDMEEFAKSGIARQLLSARRRAEEAPRERVDVDVLVLRRLEAAARFDQNRNGRIEQREWTGSPTAFAELDLDRNGVLDKADRNLARRRAPDQASATLPDRKSPPRPLEQLLKRADKDKDERLSERELDTTDLAGGFAWADTDRDGFLDMDEVQRLWRAVNELVQARTRGDARPQAWRVPFSSWDANDDGRLETAEWKERKYLFARIDQDRDAHVTPTEIERYRRSVEGATFLERFDLNDDGRVTLEEFGGSPAAFRRADQNGDGTVSRADR